MINFTERKQAKTTIKVNDHTAPYVVIDPNALNKMGAYVHGCSDEIGWLGTVEKLDGNLYHIKDVFLFKQDVHATTTEITPEGLSEFATELLQQEDGMEIWNNLKLWGHSHVNMGVTPSGQDHVQMNTFSEGGHPWFMRLIANKKGEIKIDIYDYEHGLEYHDLPWERIPFQEEKSLAEQIEALQAQMDEISNANQQAHQTAIDSEIKAKVSKIVSTWKPKVYTANQQQQSFVSNYHLNKQEVDVSTDMGFDYFVKDGEVEREFGVKELELIAEMGSVKEVHDYLWEIGYAKLSTMNDAKRVWKVAKDVDADNPFKHPGSEWYGNY